MNSGHSDPPPEPLRVVEIRKATRPMHMAEDHSVLEDQRACSADSGQPKTEVNCELLVVVRRMSVIQKAGRCAILSGAGRTKCQYPS